MTALNNISGFKLVIEAIFRSTPGNASHVVYLFKQKLAEEQQFIRDYLNDMPAIKNWKWS